MISSRNRKEEGISESHDNSLRTSSVALLIEQIAREYPRVKDKNINDWDKVNILRRWAREHTPIASPDFTLLLDYDPVTKYDTPFKFYTRSAPELFAAFSSCEGGVYCGGTAFALSRLYEVYGFESFTVNMGFPDGRLTHVVTLVDIRDGDRHVLSVQDGYFNQTFTDGEGRPLDYFSLLHYLQTSQRKDITIAESYEEADLIIRTGNEAVLDNTFFIINTRTPPRAVGPLSLYKATTPQKASEVYFQKLMHDTLLPRGYPEDLLYLFLFPFSITGTNLKRAEGLLEKARSLLNTDT
jgi:hypothetical protein